MSERSDKDALLWQQWKETGDDAYAEQLMESLAPLIQSQTSRLQGNLPPSAIQAKSYFLARKALDTYDPKYGTKVSTHVANQIMPTIRLVTKHSNFARIPEEHQRWIREYKTAHQDLRDELNREPNDAELADRMGVSVTKVGLMRREAWRDVVDTNLGASMHAKFETSVKGEVLDFMYHDLGPREKLVFEQVVGYNGRVPAKNNREISAKTGIPVAEVERIRRQLTSKIKKVMR